MRRILFFLFAMSLVGGVSALTITENTPSNKTNATMNTTDSSRVSYRETLQQWDKKIEELNQLRSNFETILENYDEIESQLLKMKAMDYIKNMSPDELKSLSYGLTIENDELKTENERMKNQKEIECQSKVDAVQNEVFLTQKERDMYAEERKWLAFGLLLSLVFLIVGPNRLFGRKIG